MLALLRTFSWQELRRYPWRNAAAVLAVMLGVALAFSVHLINASALSEFSSAVRSAGGQPDLQLRAVQGTMDEALYARVARHEQVSVASPVLELATLALAANGERKQLRVVGVDALLLATVAPALMPVPAAAAERLAMLAPDTVFLNPAARGLLGVPVPGTVRLQAGLQLREARVAGTVAAGGSALAVMDIAAAQDFFGRQGHLSRIDVKLRPGVDRAAFLRSLQLPAGVVDTEPQEDTQRISNLSRAYRVNLAVLALVALFTGAFLVYSVLSLSVARRAQQFALLGVLGLTAPQRRRLVVIESVVLGVVGSALGVALGTGLAAIALRVLGGDLGGGYFTGVAPQLQWSGWGAALYGVLGAVAAAAGGWMPARQAQQLPLAQTLKGLGAGGGPQPERRALGLVLMAAAVGLALLPPVRGIPLGAYVSVGLLLVGGITALPWAVALLYDRLAPALRGRLLPLLAVERARRVRESAAVAVSGVVAALSLAVALTVMVASFRDSVARWLDVVLPADLYVRTAISGAAADTAWFSPEFVQAVAGVEGVRRVAATRTRSLLLDPSLPNVTLLARDVERGSDSVPLVGDTHPVPAGQIPVYVSEAMVDLYRARPGAPFAPLAQAFAVDGPPPVFFVAGVWRDVLRQSRCGINKRRGRRIIRCRYRVWPDN